MHGSNDLELAFFCLAVDPCMPFHKFINFLQFVLHSLV